MQNLLGLYMSLSIRVVFPRSQLFRSITSEKPLCILSSLFISVLVTTPPCPPPAFELHCSTAAASKDFLLPSFSHLGDRPQGHRIDPFQTRAGTVQPSSMDCNVGFTNYTILLLCMIFWYGSSTPSYSMAFFTRICTGSWTWCNSIFQQCHIMCSLSLCTFNRSLQ